MPPRLSLLGKFSALSLLAMLALAIAIGTALQERIETRALRDSERLTTVFNSLAVVPNLSRPTWTSRSRRSSRRGSTRRSRGSRTRAPSCCTRTCSPPTG